MGVDEGVFVQFVQTEGLGSAASMQIGKTLPNILLLSPDMGINGNAPISVNLDSEMPIQVMYEGEE
jgi:hypothetical protein